jgi:hypothetical protein
MRLTVKSFAIMAAAVALARAIAVPAASATVGVGPTAAQARAMQEQTVRYGTPRGVSLTALPADLGHKARAASAISVTTRPKAATESGFDWSSAVVGAVVALAVVLTGLTTTRFLHRRGNPLAPTTGPPSAQGENS